MPAQSLDRVFRMRSPEGRTFPNAGCHLEGSWKNGASRGRTRSSRAVGPARPASTRGDASASFPFTALVELAPAGSGTRYTATAIHQDAAARDVHARIGFRDGWGKALDPLVAAMNAVKGA